MLVLRELSKYFDAGGPAAVDHVSLEVTRGESLALMGPSGAGKSTLLNMVGTLETPSSGEILVEGESLIGRRNLSDYRASTVGFVFQFHHLMPHLTAV